MTILSWLYWNPRKEIFEGLPIVWYSAFFAFGFLAGYFIFLYILKRYFFYFKIFEGDIKNWDLFISLLKNPKTNDQRNCSKRILGKIFKKIDREKVLFSINENFNKKFSDRLFLEKTFKCFYTLKEKASFITEKVFIYIFLATIIGARLAHLIFYEDFSYYLSNPIEIVKFWDGGIAGLASHGAVFFIILALFTLSLRLKSFYPKIRFISLLDLVTTPTLFAAFCIRIGNFFNQEILGKGTESFLGIIFGSPADGSLPFPRHPVQLYEAFFYLILFLLFFFISLKYEIFLKRGKLIGLFLISVFSFRFFIEFLKVKQSVNIGDNSLLLMGQYLSIPLVIVGIFFFFCFKKDNFSLNI